MNGFLKEFKEFAVKGNVIDMAVGIAIGSAFNNIVNSLVSDIIMPLVAAIASDTNFTDLKAVLKIGKDGEAITLNYGQFIQYVFNFIIIAFSIYLVVRTMNRIRNRIRPQDNKEEAPTKSPELLELEKISKILESK